MSTLNLQLAVGKEGNEDLDLGCLPRFLCYKGGVSGRVLRHIRQLELSFYAVGRRFSYPDPFAHKSAFPLLVDPALSEDLTGLSTLEDLAIVYDDPLYHLAQLLLSQFSINRASNLKSLSLESNANAYLWSGGLSYPRPTWDEFRLAMTSFQKLQHLKLSGALEDLRSPSDTNADPIYNQHAAPHVSSLVLPQLRSLSLSGSYKSLIQFLRSLEIPPATRVDIGPKFEDHDEIIVKFFESLSQIFSHTLQSPAQDNSTQSRDHSSSHFPPSVERPGDDFGIELSVHQPSRSLDLCVSLDPHRRDGVMDNLDTDQMQSINVKCTRVFPIAHSQALFDGIAQHIQPLTSPKHHYSQPHRYICLSYREEELSGYIVQAFSGFKRLDSICISARSSFGRALSRGIVNCGCIRDPHDLREGTQLWTVQADHDGRSSSLCHECRSFLGLYFPELRRLTIVGPCGERHELEKWADEELLALKRVLWYFHVAGRKLERLEFKRWSNAREVGEWEPFCDQVLWVED
ncbi:hypothetical protein AX16_007021 [Volvariella volvacea WC 439]|nr:hypothetical protein AX16_007021 [Volvariella volvacea WC 439]